MASFSVGFILQMIKGMAETLTNAQLQPKRLSYRNPKISKSKISNL